MLLRIHAPQPPLSEYVEMFTYYEDYHPDHSIERLLPEGVVEIIIDMTDEPKFIYDNGTLKPVQTCRKSWISGMRSKYISISVVNRSAMFVIRFRRGMAWPFLQMPLSALDDSVVDGEQVFGSAFSTLRQMLMDAKQVEEKFSIAGQFILRRLENNGGIHPAVRYAINHLQNHATTATIREMAQKTGYSHKHLLSLFGTYAGLTPKQFLRIVKFQHAVLALEQRRQIHWTQLAHDCGYYDQAHFINDFKEFSGFSPTEYIRMKSEFVNYVPIL
jgi:AraC-like DNA-binding protein